MKPNLTDRQRLVFAAWLASAGDIRGTAVACGITPSAVRENVRRVKRAIYNEMRAHLAGAEKIRRKPRGRAT
jgi:hypothetical protein